MTILRLLLVLLTLALPGGLLAACGGGSDDDGRRRGHRDPGPVGRRDADQRDDKDNAKVTLTIGSKNFTEQKVLGEIFAQGLQAAGYTVRKRLDLGDERVALEAMENGEIDAYPEYTGTALLSFFGKQPDELPKDPQEAYAEAKKGFAERGMVAFPPTPFTSANEVAVTKDTAARLSLQKISDLKGQEDQLTLAGAPRVPRAAGLPARAGARLQAPFQALHPHRRSPTGTRHSPPGKPTSRSCSRPIRRSSGSPRCCSRTTGACSRPTTPRLVVRKEVADAAGPDLPKTLRDDPGEADGREHAGAQRQGRPRRPGTRRGGQGVPDRERFAGQRLNGRRPSWLRLGSAPLRMGENELVN